MSARGIVIGVGVDGGGSGGGCSAGHSVGTRLTRRGRLALTTLMTGLLAVGLLAAGGASEATRDVGEPESISVVEVQQGQTLWEIASDVAAPGETREMVYRIRELNSLPGSSLVEGQELAVPSR